MASKMGSLSGPPSALDRLSRSSSRLDLTSRQTRTALLATASAILLSALVLPSLLPSRFTLFGVHGVRDVFSSLWTGKAHRASSKKAKLERWIESEKEYAWRRLLANIHPSGTDPGCVVASPSKKDPDYYYQWTRDSAMVFKVVVEHWKRGQDPSGTARQLILDFVSESKKMQRMDTPSGGFKTGGLGEVKYNVDGTPFTGSWGRPQNDGPALRAMLFADFANTLLDKMHSEPNDWEAFVRRELYDGLPYETTESIIKADLDYVCKVWKEQCFDLWEEVNGVHHFNMLVSIRALLDGAALARRLDDPSSAERYEATAGEIEQSLGRFWDEDKKYLRVSVDVKNDHGKDSLLDTGTVLGFLHSGELPSRNADEYLGSDKSLLTQHAIGTSMRGAYWLNQKHYPAAKGHIGYAVGRYVEDVYDGDGKIKPGYGNPWYLCTLAHAEFFYRLAVHFASKPVIISAETRPFWMEIGYFTSPEEEELLDRGQTYGVASKEHPQILAALRAKGDAFVGVVRDWAKWNGGLWEQFDRNSGHELGAPNLTWSYAAFLSCMAAREGKPMFK